MIGKRNIGRFYGVLLATMYATLVTGIIYGLSRPPLGWVFVLFVALWIGFYFAGVWAAVDRPAELNRKLPLSSKELRRRKKEFYDWLARGPR
jgi:hypothetical protein